MKVSVRFFLFLLLNFFYINAESESANIVSQDPTTISISVGSQDICVKKARLENFGEGSLFCFEKGKEMRMPKSGTPNLPLRKYRVIVPNRGELSVTVTDIRCKPLGHYRILPRQKDQLTDGTTFPYTIDSVIYKTDNFFPENPVKIESIDRIGDFRIATITYSPIKNNPVSGLTEEIEKILFSIKVNKDIRGQNEVKKNRRNIHRTLLPILKQCINFSQTPTRPSETPGTFIFLGDQSTLKEAKDLINWKIQSGYNVLSVDVDTVGSSSSKIDSWIEDMYDNLSNPLEYLMILGGENIVPSPTQNQYESDNRYGVVGSGDIPSIHVGRITSNGDNYNIGYQAWKTVKYEKEPTDGSWHSSATLWGCVEQYNGHTTANKWASILDGTFSCTTEFEDIGNHKGNTLINEFNEGISVFGMKGHGSPTSWASASVTISALQSYLDNGMQLPWINDIACNNSTFSARYCFAEAWMCEGDTTDPKGAIGLFSYTVSSSIGGADNMLSGTFEALSGGEIHTVGAACDYGKSQCNNSSDINGGMNWGDPSLDIYTVSTLKTFDINANQPLPNNTYSVEVKDSKGKPVEDAMVSLVTTDYKKLCNASFSNKKGFAELQLPPFEYSTYLTVTAHDFKPFIKEFAAVPIASVKGISSSRSIIQRNKKLILSGYKDYSLKIFNTNGRIVTRNNNLPSSFSLDQTNMAKGTYFVTIENKINKVTKRIVIN